MPDPEKVGENGNEGNEGQEGKEGEKTQEKVAEFETLNVHGQERKVTRDEVLVAAQKHLAGDDSLKRNSEAVKLLDDMKAVKEHHDLDAFRRVAGFMGGDPGAIEASIQQAREAQATQFKEGEEKEGTPTKKGAPKPDKEEGFTFEDVVSAVSEKMGKGGPVGIDALDPKLRDVILGMAESRMSDVVEKALDNDPVLGKILKGGEEKLRGAVRSLAYQEVKRRAQTGSNVLAGQGVQDALQVVRAQLEALGVGGPGGSIPHSSGLGSVPGGSGVLHPPTTPAKRPSGGMADPGYANFLTQLIQEKLVESPGD